MNYAQLVAFADNLTSVCPVDKDGKTTLDVLRHIIMEHPHFFPQQNPRMESMAEDAECLGMCLDAAGVPTKRMVAMGCLFGAGSNALLIESAAEHLPDGWEIRIHVEKGSGLVIAVRPDESEVAMCDGESDIAEQFRLAMCLAQDETAADLMANA